jgi:DNA-binding transcriptional LysR family regulator
MHKKALEVFCAAARKLNFSEAAKDHDLTQSAVSQIISQLEEELGVELFVRFPRPLKLSEPGKTFYEGCRRVLAEYQELEESVRREESTRVSNVRVAAIYSVGLGDMGKLVECFQAEHPQARIHVEYLHPDRVYERVLDGTADFGLVSFPRKLRGLVTHSWRDEEMVLACAPRHALAGRLLVKPADLEGEKYIGFDRELVIRREVDRFLREQGVTVDVTLEFDNIDSIKKAIEIAAGIALLPAPTLRREVEAQTLVAVPLYGCQLVRPLGIIRHRHHRLGSSAQRFLDLLLEPSQDSSSPGSASAGAAKPAKPRTRGNGAPHGRNGAPKTKLKETK